MPETIPYAERLKQALQRVDSLGPGAIDKEAIDPLKRTLERGLARLDPGCTLPPSTFRYQVTGGKAILCQGTDVLPLEPTRLVLLLNALELKLETGEMLEVDGGLTAWVIRPEANLTESNLRQADITIRGIKPGRDRDHVAAQTAETNKIRLRARLTVLVAALQVASREAAGTASPLPAAAASPLATPVAAPAPLSISAPPTPPPKPKDPVVAAPSVPEMPPNKEVLEKALGKMIAIIESSGFKAAAIGDIAHHAWGSKKEPQRIELLVSCTPSQRETILTAAKAEGFQPAPNGRPLHLRYPDVELNGTAPIEMMETANPYLKQVLTRSQTGLVYDLEMQVASCDDLILMRVTSESASDRESILELMCGSLAYFDSAYLKREAEAAGIITELKAAWVQAKQLKETEEQAQEG